MGSANAPSAHRLCGSDDRTRAPVRRRVPRAGGRNRGKVDGSRRSGPGSDASSLAPTGNAVGTRGGSDLAADHAPINGTMGSIKAGGSELSGYRDRVGDSHSLRLGETMEGYPSRADGGGERSSTGSRLTLFDTAAGLRPTFVPGVTQSGGLPSAQPQAIWLVNHRPSVWSGVRLPARGH